MATKVIHRSKAQVLVILGPTASGKTDLGVALAAELDGEIISADSRQVYKGLDIGTGKDLAKYKVGRKNIRYHLIDVADPRQEFNLAKYQKAANLAIQDILRRGKLPIIVGGSGLYLQALVDNYELASVLAVSDRRQALAKLSAAELWRQLRELKPDFAQRLNNSDKNNPRRLARYLEIIESGEEPAGGRLARQREALYDFLLLGLDWPDKILRERISFRILARLEKEGMVAEVKKLHDNGLSWERLQSFGLEYKFISRHLLGELTYQEMIDKLTVASWRFAKRQRTWFRRWERQGTEIRWIKDAAEARRVIKK